MVEQNDVEKSIVFLSYRRRDSGTEATQLHRVLARRYGAERVFIDVGTSAGTDWPSHIREKLDNAAVLLVLVGHYWMESTGSSDVDWVATEVEEGLAQKNTTVIPVFVGGVDRFPDQLPEPVKELSDRMAHVLRPSDFEADLDELLAVIDQHMSPVLASRTSFRVMAGLGALLVAGFALSALLLGWFRGPTETVVTASPTASVAPQPEATVEAVEPTEETDATAAPSFPERLVDTWAMANHPGGSQLFVTAVQIASDKTTVYVDIINGRDFATTFDAREAATRLVDTDETTYALLESAKLRLEHGRSGSLVLEFEPIPVDAEQIRLEFNSRSDDEQSAEEGRPGFTVDVNFGGDAPALPKFVEIDDTAVHSSMSLRVLGIGFTETNIAVAATVANGATRRAAATAGHHGSYLEDDLGNRYWMRFDSSNRQIYVPNGRHIEAIFVFGGRVHPDATSLHMVLNHESWDTETSAPRIAIGPWPLDGTFIGSGTIAPLIVEETQVHANSASVTLHDLTFNDASTTVDITVLNTYRLQVYLQGGVSDNSYLLDDLGNRYIFEGPPGNASMQVAKDVASSIQLFVPGRIDAKATSIRFVLNDRNEGDADNPVTSYPELWFGPYDLVREESDSPGTFEVSSIDTWTSWVEPGAERTEVSEAALP